jgi:cytochrome P450
VIGFAHRLFGRPLGDTLLQFMKDVPNEGLISIPSIFGIHKLLLLTNPASLGEVLVHKSYDYEKPTELRGFLRLILGDGLIVVEGDEHKFQRKHISPAFGFRHVKDLYPKFWSKAIALSHGIAADIAARPEYADENGSANPQGVVEVNHWANKVTMDIIGVAGAGREFNSLFSSDDELIKNYEEILEPTTEKAVFFGANLLFGPTIIGMLPWKLNDRLKATTARLRNICLELVRDRKAQVKTQSVAHNDILSLLVKSNNFSDDMLVDQLLTFLAAG